MAKARALRTTPTPIPGDVRLMHVTANVLYVVAGLALMVLALNLLARMPVFALRTIQVEGDVARNSVSTIRANAAPRLAGNFFTIDLPSGKRAFESVPWVRQAVVKRVWPNRLAVRLEEHRAAAVWGGSDSATDKLVNSYGEVFEANLGDVEDDSLPTFSGPDGSAIHMLAMLNRLAPLLERLDARIDGLSLSGRGSWRIELDSGAEVELGRGSDDEVLARTERFIATLTQVTSRFQRPLEYADLRHGDGYAVRLKGITTVIPAAKERKK
ncbi:MAG TPA: cell division protein FtsQ/DivIB [Albitalea sp.]|nr:cell division protein FtsQ/DivIB [Albitalea sp.]